MKRLLLGLCAVSLLATACGGDDSSDPATSAPLVSSSPAPAPTTTVPGATTTLPALPDIEPAEKIISLSPTATETIFALGAEGRLLAVDDQSNFPEGALSLQAGLSGFEPNIESIAALQPDVVLHDGTVPGFADQLESLGIRSWVGAAATTFDDIDQQILELGALTDTGPAAQALVLQIDASIQQIVDSTTLPAEPLTYFHELDNTLFTARSDTFIGQVYGLFGMRNIADRAEDASDYPQLSAEFVISSDPDLIFLADADYGESPETVAARPGWADLQAVRNGTVIPVSADITSRWGPRVVDFVQLVADSIAKVPG
jgi:iron complex transport system substrate-binding protein